MALNKIDIHGYLGRDPELKDYTNAKGEAGKLVNLSVGVSRVGDGTDWFDVTFFGKKAEAIEKFFRKGSQIVISGRMQSSVSEKDGHKRKFWSILGESFDFCDSKDSSKEQTSPSAVDDLPDTWEQAEEDNPF